MKRIKWKIKERRASLLLLPVAPVLTFYLLEWYTHNPFETMKATPQFLNIFMFELIGLLLFALYGRLHLALMTETLFFALYGLVNYFVLDFRSVPIQPWDLFSIGTAASVADNYTYTLDANAAAALTGFALLFAAEAFCRFSLKKGTWKFRLPSAAALLILMTAFGMMFRSDDMVQKKLRLYDKLFTPTTISFKNGTALAFLMELRYLSVEKPEDYHPEEIAEELAALKTEGQTGAVRPNIIVIMDEAFSDLAVLGDFSTSTDYMPFVHRLMDGADNTVSGRLHVSVVGGNTANTEFEYLTGISMAFLPQGSVPYQQYISGPLPSLASELSNLGYRTVAMHPYRASGWDRDEVYPFLGFSESLFLPAFTDPKLVRNYVSDRCDFDKIKEIYEEQAGGDAPLFLFNVTMQNHSSYTERFDNFLPDVEVTEGGTPALNQYLSLLKLTDGALRDLVEYFDEQEEPTILVFFGDHQPANSVAEPVLRLNGRRHATLTEEEMADRYQVPFLIRANYDIEEAAGVETSVNYLGAATLWAAGLPMSGYWNYLLSFSATAPVLSAHHAILADGTFTDVKEQKELFATYQKYQYYRLYDAPQSR